MKKKIMVAVALAAIAVGAWAYSASGQNTKIFTSTRSGSHDVSRYYDSETDVYIYVTNEGLQVLKGRSWDKK